MVKGKIKKIARDRGFGFIKATDGREIFFHQNSLLNAKFEEIAEDQNVEFEVKKSFKGLNAININVVSQP